MKEKMGPAIVVLVCLAILFVVPAHAKVINGTVISKDGVPISFSVSGKGEPALVFVHGWSCDRSFWRKQIPYFETRHRVVALDLAGHGASGSGRDVYSLQAFGEDVAAVVRAVGARKAILIGHSMGGPVIIETAKILPDDVLALVGIDTMQDFEESFTPEQIKEFIKPFKEHFKKTADAFVRGMFVQGTDPEFIDEIAGKMSNASERVGISAMEEMLNMSYKADPPKIKAPVWCLNSDLWPTKPVVNRKYVPEFNLRVMKGVGHFLMLESPDEFNRQLDRILTEIDP